MKWALQEQLMKKYPKLFKYNHDKSNPTMPVAMFGVECGSGWYNLIDILFERIDSYITNNDKDMGLNLTQVKEKFGTLRVYYQPVGNWDNGNLDHVDGMIDLAEALSGHICEICGNPGNIDPEASWLKCRCPEHENE